VKWLMLFAVLLCVAAAPPVFADSPEERAEATPAGSQPEKPASSAPLPSSEEVAEAIEGGPEGVETVSTDPAAAEGVPRGDLGRSEALELMEGVFEPELEAPAGIFDELEVEKFLAPNVAVVAGGQQQLADGAGGTEADGAALLDSTIPLRTETPSGTAEAVDLDLERAEGELQSANPLVEVGVPDELSNGIDLPESGIHIDLVDAPPERKPTIVDGSVAGFPNVAEDTDFAIAPTPTGFETLTQLRTARAPQSETYKLSLPAGATLAEEGEGAVVTREGKPLLGIAPPTGIDANGTPVPTSLSVSGDSLTVTVSPSESAQLPILVDPVFQTYEWMAKNTEEGFNYYLTEGWGPYEHSEGDVFDWGSDIRTSRLNPPMTYGLRGLYTASISSAAPGSEFFYLYHVPRYYSDPQQHEGREPETFITKMTVSDMGWQAESEKLNPYVYMGLWGPSAGWASLYTHEGLTGHSLSNFSWVYTFPNEQNVPDVKVAEIGIRSTESVYKAWDYLYVGAATIEMSEPAGTIPKFAEVSGPTGWVNQATVPVNFKVEDAGLGVSSVTVSGEQGSSPPSWKATYNCTGVAGHPCPYTWKSSKSIEPAALPQGIDNLKLVAQDPIGHVSTVEKEGKILDSHVQVKVDHTAPGLALSGSLTEQSKLGNKLPTYKLNLNATDGSEAAPQSGVAKTVVEVDGQVVDEAAPGCSTRNCSIAREWTLEASQFAVGTHTAKVTATDAVGLSTSKTVNFELHPAPPPSLVLSGTMTEQATLGTSRPHYKLKVDANAEAGIEGGLAEPAYASSFGSSGAGSGQFAHPAGVALDAKGNLWVADENNKRIEKFNAAGEYLSSVGSSGTGNGQFSRPTDIAVDAKGNLWATDASNNRIEEFNEKGEFLKAVGSTGSGNLQFSGPECLAIDAKGNIWVGDTYNHRLLELNENGEFIRTVSSYGSGTGQLVEPTGIAVGPGGNVWVADWGNQRIEEFSESGAFVRQFGSSGSGNGQFARPDVIEVDSRGDVWVGDQNNERIQEFTQTGEFVAKFGTAGSGAGQFSFGWPMGIAADSNGHLWIADTGNNRVQRWQVPGYTPTYVTAVGSAGSGNGQFAHPADAAFDASGNMWVADENNNRLQEFTAKGEFLKSLGSLGSGNGQFSRPKSIAFAANGSFWVADSGNSRLEQLNAQGEFLKAVGSSGSGNGQFSGPEGVAIDAKGNLWVSDTYNHRIQELNERGEFIKIVNPAALGAIEPTGIDVSGGNVWVADWAHNRVVELNEAGEFIRSFGTSGAGNGQFARPDAVAVGAQGIVWIGDQNNGRIQGFNQSGEYVTQFGAPGSGTGQFSFSYPLGIGVDPHGNLWVADTNNNRVQEWREASIRSELTTEITLDGQPVDSAHANCATETCPLTREWMLESATHAGTHTVQVKATDGLGRTTTKTLAIEIQPDTTKPALEVGGGLFNAPEGWVEQEGYGFTAAATDQGSGVTSIALRIDGSPVATAAQACAEGGCAESLSKTVDMASYAGGSHSAEVIATDAAGNSTTRRWTINVDPEGHISAAEAENTLEAADETSESTVVAPTSEVLEQEQRESGDDPGLQLSGSEITSTGVSDKTTMTTDPSEGFTIHSPEGQTKITPVVGQGASSTSIAEGVAAVTANTGQEADLVVRPEFNGVQTFQAIRSAESPETYSWQVHLAEGQSLRLANSTQAEVVYEDGTLAFLISAEAAHDATGTAVPTSLSVNGSILTLKVEFRSGQFVYPVVAGQGWETSYRVPVIVEGPEDETQIREREERERAEREAQEAGEEAAPPPPSGNAFTPSEAQEMMKSGAVEEIVPAPAPPSGGGATASSVEVKTVKPLKVCQTDHCSIWHVELKNPSYFYKLNSNNRLTAWWEPGTQVHSSWYYPWYYAPELNVEGNGCGFVGPGQVWQGEHKHLTIWGRYTISATAFLPDGGGFTETNHLALQIWVWPNGYQQRIVKHWTPNVEIEEA
jgi:sugar lactone lactonase YvrE